MDSSRISLPSGMLMPMSNLEWWNYNDRPDFFIEIPQPEDPLDRMLKVVRWWYSKDTKWMVGYVGGVACTHICSLPPPITHSPVPRSTCDDNVLDASVGGFTDFKLNSSTNYCTYLTALLLIPCNVVALQTGETIQLRSWRGVCVHVGRQ